MDHINYVCGFAFSKDKFYVLLIEKQKPEQQKGLYNGIGGKIEAGESPEQAMVREFKEETGLETGQADWEKTVVLESPRFTVHFFRSCIDIFLANSMEIEKVYPCPVSCIPEKRLANLAWLVPMHHNSNGIVFPFTVPMR